MERNDKSYSILILVFFCRFVTEVIFKFCELNSLWYIEKNELELFPDSQYAIYLHLK